MLRVALLVPVPAPTNVDEAGLLHFHRTNLRQATALAALGVEVHLLVDGPEARALLVAPGVTVHVVPHPFSGGTEELAGPGVHLVSKAASLEDHVLHQFHFLSVKTLVPAGLVKGRLFAEYNGGQVPSSRVRRLVMRAVARRVAGVFFTAPEQAQPFVEAGVLKDSAVHLVPEVSSVLPGPELDPGLRARARAELGADDGDLVLLYVGRLDRDKDPLTVLDTFAGVRAVRPSAKLIVAAPSGELFGAFNERLRADPTLVGRVFLRWALPHEEMPASYAAADVFVHPSRREISGYAFIEALQWGLPIAGTDLPAFRAMGQGAVELCPPGDVPAFTAAVLRLASDPHARARARARFEAGLTFDVIARRKLAAYRGEPPAGAY